MATAADGYVFQPECVQDILAVFDTARETGHQIVLRGSARSYGDAAIGAECIVLDMGKFNRILQWDPNTGLMDMQAGATLTDIWNKSLPDGWWIPVVSGTSKPTIGGALAMNIHGKNNFKRGTLGEHVAELDLLLTTGQTVTLTPNEGLFYAAISGLGLLGVITRVKLQLKRVHSGNVRVEAISCRNWDEQFATFERYEGDPEYVVSWIDCFAKGPSEGRGIVHVAWNQESALERDPTLMLDHQTLPTKILGVPKSSIWRIFRYLNNRPGMKLLNTAKYFVDRAREHGKTHNQSFAKYNFLLDYVPNWERAYLPGGLIQCQYFVPKQHARKVFSDLVHIQQREKQESFLAVMKRHRPDNFLMSHAVDGYSLALDFKVPAHNPERVFEVARKMNDYALDHGGRFYFAKDSALDAGQAKRFLGEALTKFREVKAKLDPENLLTSDLARRLALIEH
jgi:decaprenylphospho-beta-D-ribofuranose 2-oxidase